jgi:hypothetical protein
MKNEYTNSMKRFAMIAALGVVLTLMGSCSTSDHFYFLPHGKNVVTSSPSASYVWDPEYYVYKNGKYRFVSGNYRPVFSRKNHFKRSLKGYMYKSDVATAR